MKPDAIDTDSEAWWRERQDAWNRYYATEHDERTIEDRLTLERERRKLRISDTAIGDGDERYTKGDRLNGSR